MSVSLALDILMGKRRSAVISEEVILKKDRLECLVNLLVELLKIQSLESVKLRFTEDKIVAVPLCKPVEMKR